MNLLSSFYSNEANKSATTQFREKQISLTFSPIRIFDGQGCGNACSLPHNVQIHFNFPAMIWLTNNLVREGYLSLSCSNYLVLVMENSLEWSVPSENQYLLQYANNSFMLSRIHKDCLYLYWKIWKWRNIILMNHILKKSVSEKIIYPLS